MLMLTFSTFVCMLLLMEVVASVMTDADKIWFAAKRATNEAAIFSQNRVHVLRLGPGEDLLQSLWRYARVTNISAASILSVVGSLVKTNVRYANEENGISLEGHFEIVSVVGNIDFQNSSSSVYEGSGHIHIAFADNTGTTVGGHLLDGNIIYTTAEITILEIVNGEFKRVADDGPNGSGYYELKVFHN